MRQRLPPLQWLRSFEAAARHSSFTLAAEEIAITQSAVSQQVKALEQFLGQALFLRRPRALQLTDAGRNYLPTVREAFAVLAEGTAVFLGHDPQRIVEIKANTAFSVLWLAPRLKDFIAAHPGFEVNLSTAMWESDFTGGSGSVEIRFGRGEWRDEPGELLTRAKLVAVAAPEVARRIAHLEDLARETLLRVGPLIDDWERWFEGVGAAPLEGRESHSFNTYVLSVDLARRGQGVACVHDFLAAAPIAAGELVRVFGHEVAAREAYYLMGARHGEMNRAARLFCAWLRAQFG